VLPHPRAWLTAQVTAFLTCFVLVAIGLVWRELRLTERQRSVGLIAGFISAYLGLVGNVFIAVVDLPGPASQPGVAAPMPQGAIFPVILAIVVPSTLIAFGMVMYGMRGEPSLTERSLMGTGA
jgi:hypothetical protein